LILATIPCLVALVGLLAYAMAANPKVAELGRIAFAFGLLVTLLALEHTGAVHVFP
jgi:hypothetical protein